MIYRPSPGPAADAARALIYHSALDDLRDRGWLLDTAAGWEITDAHHFQASTGEKALLDLLDGICTDIGVHLSLLAKLDERNRLAALSAVGLLLGVDREAA